MSDNPYQTPSASVSRPTGGARGTGTFTIGQSLSEGWAATTANLGMVIGVMFVSFVIIMVSALTIIGYFVVVPVMMWGLTRFGLNLIDGRAQFGDIFSGFNQYGSRLGRSLLLAVIFFVISMVINIPYFIGSMMDSGLFLGIGWIVSTAISLFVMPRVYFSMLYMVDRDMGAMESITASLERTRPLWGKTIGLMIVAGLVGMAGIIALVVGLLVSIPVSYAMYVSAYRQMEGGGEEA